MINLPCIEDLSKLKITKVKHWKVCFEYSGDKYILISDSDSDDCGLILYKKTLLDKDKFKLEFIASKLTSEQPSELIMDISKNKPTSLVYSNINREFFVKKLTELGFNNGKYKDEYQAVQDNVHEIYEEIRELTRKASGLYKEWRTTNKRGSKQYGIEIKRKVAERVEGAKVGEYCEEYNAYYGDVHPEYGGKLVDLFNFEVGTSFYVTNGGYSALISVDEHGDKVIVTPCSVMKLTKNKHSAYIYEEEQ